MVILVEHTGEMPKAPYHIEQVQAQETHPHSLLGEYTEWQRSMTYVKTREQTGTSTVKSESEEPSSFAVHSEVIKRIDQGAAHIVRAHISKRILSALDRLQPLCGSPSAAVFVEQILTSIRQLRDTIPLDPYTEVLVAVYDALVANNAWTEYNADHYAGLSRLLQGLLSSPSISPSRVEKTIIALEDLGFDTTPFPTSDSFEEED